jgi:probable rRNA maturation factor
MVVSAITSTLGVEVYLEDVYVAQSHLETSPFDYPHTVEIWHNWFNNWLSYLQDYLPQASSYELSLRLTNDDEIQQLNAQYLQKNTPTDVLSFATLEVETNHNFADFFADEPLYLGDLIISLDTALTQAQTYNHSLEIELAWLASHGLLHLLGWDHLDQASLMEMLTLQETLLKSVSLDVSGLLEKSSQAYLHYY